MGKALWTIKSAYQIQGLYAVFVTIYIIDLSQCIEQEWQNEQKQNSNLDQLVNSELTWTQGLSEIYLEKVYPNKWMNPQTETVHDTSNYLCFNIGELSLAIVKLE